MCVCVFTTVLYVNTIAQVWATESIIDAGVT